MKVSAGEYEIVRVGDGKGRWRWWMLQLKLSQTNI